MIKNFKNVIFTLYSKVLKLFNILQLALKDLFKKLLILKKKF